MNIVEAGIFYKHDRVADIMRKIRDVVELDISKATFNRRLLGKVFSTRVEVFRR
jgi:hypothetical protein